MLLAFAVWLCTLPLVALILQPRLGWTGAGVVALALLVILLLVCRRLCSSEPVLRGKTGL